MSAVIKTFPPRGAWLAVQLDAGVALPDFVSALTSAGMTVVNERGRVRVAALPHFIRKEDSTDGRRC
jgi:hypothetical protein